MRIWVLIILAVLQIGAAPVAAPAIAPSETVKGQHASLVALLGNPRRFDGQQVIVSGFLNLEFEGDALYLSEGDFDAFATQNAIWINGPDPENVGTRNALTGHYVTVTGRFDADHHGHLGMYAGAIEAAAIYRIATRREISISSRYDPYTVHLPVHIDIPWPLILGALYFAVLVGTSVALGRVGEAPRGRLLLVAGFGLFSLVRITGAASALWLDSRYRIRGDYTILHTGELALGLIGLIGMLVVWRRRSWLPLLTACVIQLAAPTAIEAIRFDGLFPVNNGRDWSWDGEWKRPSASAPRGAPEVKTSDAGTG